jgi:uncharacterized iron-regulated membrane protein
VVAVIDRRAPNQQSPRARHVAIYDLSVRAGLPIRLLVCATGIGVAMLSVTGVVVWWRKRAERVKAARRRAVSRATADEIETAARTTMAH